MLLTLTTDGRLASPRVQADGTVIYQARLSRVGVFDYSDVTPPRLDYRSPEEVFDPDAMRSFDGMAATDDHPAEGVSVANRSELAVGYIVPGSVRRDGAFLVGDIHVTDARMIAKIRAGKTAVSLGYDVTHVVGDGVSPDGEIFTHRQTKIRGNHVSFVDMARAGREARVQLDGKRSPMDEQLKKAIEQIAALTVERDNLKKTVDTVTGERDSLRDKLDNAVKSATDGIAAARTGMRARIALENQVAGILGVTVDGLVEKTDRELRVAAIDKLSGKQIPADKTDDYVAARFDAIVEDGASRAADAANAAAKTRLAAGITTPTTAAAAKFNADGTPNFDAMTAAEVQKHMSDQQHSAWKVIPAKKGI